MLKPAARVGLAVLAAIVLLGLIVAGVLTYRMSAGPIRADGLRPAVERALERQVEGGRASVGHVDIIWFGQARAAGLRLSDVNLEDGRGRPVLRAKVVETGLGTDSILRFSPAPAHLTLKDFFVATSVSTEGRYALGYDAQGPPPVIDLAEVVFALAGKARRDRPLSFIRHVDLTNGELLLRQIDGPVSWRGRIDKVTFEKDHKHFTASALMTINEGAGVAALNAQAGGEVGLKALTMRGRVSGLVPARIFPWVGFARRLSLVDAPVEGEASVEYAADKGVTAADVSGTAGAGNLRLGPVIQPMQGASLLTRYDAARRQVVLEHLRLEAERTRLDIGGRAWLVPETAKTPARVEYRLTSAESLIAAEPTATPQRLRDVSVQGAVTPERGRFEIRDLRLKLGETPVRGKALIWRGRDARASPGVKAELDVDGPMSIQSLYAFWPGEVAGAARAWVVPRLRAATVTRASVRADIPPGRLDRRRLENRMLNVAADYKGAVLNISPELPGIEAATGTVLVQGDRLELKTASARLAGFAIRDASIVVPRFEEGATIAVKSRVVGDLGDMLRLVGSPPMNMMASSNMSPDRFSGPADLTIKIRRPLRREVDRADYEVSFEGDLLDLTIKDVTLGEDLTRARMKTRGTLDFVEADGTGHVGPFSGGLGFRMPMSGPEKGRKYINLDGRVSLAGVKGAPFKGTVTTKNGIGGGTFNSGVFKGRSDWRKGERMLATGVGRAEAWRRAGVPAGPGMPEETPVRIAMTSKDGVWSGDFEADAFTGKLSWDREERVVRYAAEITPDEADRMGLGGLPMFDRTQNLEATVRLQETSGAIDYALGGLTGRAEWIEGGGARPLAYHLMMTLDKDDFAGLGLPLRPREPLRFNAQGGAADGGATGQATLAGAELRYEVAPAQEGRRQIDLFGALNAASLASIGIDVGDYLEGDMAFSGHLVRAQGGAISGHLGGDFDKAALRIPNSDWAKPAGARARAAVDLTANPEGGMRLGRIAFEGKGLDVRGTGTVSRDGKVTIDLPRALLEGFFDGQARISQGQRGLEASATARYLDVRPILKEAQQEAANGIGEGDGGSPVRFRAAIDRVRVTNNGYVEDVKLSGSWGKIAQRQAKLTASTPRGAAIEVDAFPDAGGTALRLHVADLGDVATVLAGYDNLRGGETDGTGRIVPGGYDLTFQVRDMTILRVPGAAQMVATDGAIFFSRVEAPMRIRGSEVTLGEMIATGPSVGMTARGIMDTRTRTMDLVGVVTPAYLLNAPFGGLLGSREGEGVFGITYTARGPFTDPEIEINPLSIAAPGALRRLFEPRTPKHD